MKILFEKDKLAYCGLYCAECSFKTAYEENDVKHLAAIPYSFTQRPLETYNCECCKGYCICGPCKIKPCAEARQIDSCATCSAFPCAHINAFSNDGMPHHKEAVENLYAIQKNGAEVWFRKKVAPRLYSKNGARQSWYLREGKDANRN
ncbi:MAG: DUF3795 domain-containing protein [Christensenellaceae bacterium]|jgi:hypothetical protein